MTTWYWTTPSSCTTRGWRSTNVTPKGTCTAIRLTPFSLVPSARSITSSMALGRGANCEHPYRMISFKIKKKSSIRKKCISLGRCQFVTTNKRIADHRFFQKLFLFDFLQYLTRITLQRIELLIGESLDINAFLLEAPARCSLLATPERGINWFLGVISLGNLPQEEKWH